MLNEFDLFNFGNDEQDVILLYKVNGELKYKSCPRSFLKKVDETYHLKREIRKLKMYLSIKNIITRDQVFDVLHDVNGGCWWTYYREQVTPEQKIKRDVLHKVWHIISKIYEE